MRLGLESFVTQAGEFCGVYLEVGDYLDYIILNK